MSNKFKPIKPCGGCKKEAQVRQTTTKLGPLCEDCDKNVKRNPQEYIPGGGEDGLTVGGSSDAVHSSPVSLPGGGYGPGLMPSYPPVHMPIPMPTPRVVYVNINDDNDDSDKVKHRVYAEDEQGKLTKIKNPKFLEGSGVKAECTKTGNTERCIVKEQAILKHVLLKK